MLAQPGPGTEKTSSAVQPGAWFALALLTAMTTFNQIDRRVASLVIEPLKHEFLLTDAQLGMLTGLAFGMIYALTSIPLGLLADRVNRSKLLALVVAVWSAMTAFAGFATSYAHLLLTRVGVGAAESGASPTATSIITDLFPRDKRATAVAIYQTGIPIGSFLCFIVGAWIVAHYGWRAAFMAAGLPGIPLAILIYVFLKEPKRGFYDQNGPAYDGAWRQRLSDAIGFIGRDKRVLLLMVGAALLSAANTGVTGWFVPFLMREQGMSIQSAGMVIAFASGICGGIGLIFTGALTDRIAKGDPNRMLIMCGVIALLTMVLAACALLAPSVALTVVAISAYSLVCYSFLGISYGALLNLTPSGFRGTVISIEMVMANLFGYGGGPFVVGVLSDAYGGPHSLKWAMLTLNLLYLAGGGCFLIAGRLNRKRELAAG
ncbi:MFS transporter [Sphingomonas sp. So64.6b]|uniref:spinster family MFS transporter n=1 Tax=Sphingomonas sp. So64.6b TaxID=2997354 RepID=UPI0016044FF1|nr:MFS transporter [Sphingomonas sp. So64.6b]QNA86617.1 MFS transporter [Sphingomonas sp. So64.6b]